MSTNDIHAIEPGWSVTTSDGHKAGSVKEVTSRYILVSTGLMGGEDQYLPAAALEHVQAEFKRIEVSITKSELDEGDWSRPPAHGPRRSGRPLNAPAEQEPGYPSTDATHLAESGERVEGLSFSDPDERPDTVRAGAKSDAAPDGIDPNVARRRGPRRRF